MSAAAPPERRDDTRAAEQAAAIDRIADALPSAVREADRVRAALLRLARAALGGGELERLGHDVSAAAAERRAELYARPASAGAGVRGRREPAHARDEAYAAVRIDPTRHDAFQLLAELADAEGDGRAGGAFREAARLPGANG